MEVAFVTVNVLELPDVGGIAVEHLTIEFAVPHRVEHTVRRIGFGILGADLVSGGTGTVGKLLFALCLRTGEAGGPCRVSGASNGERGILKSAHT